jgi:hypothetical protein
MLMPCRVVDNTAPGSWQQTAFEPAQPGHDGHIEESDEDQLAMFFINQASLGHVLTR